MAKDFEEQRSDIQDGYEQGWYDSYDKWNRNLDPDGYAEGVADFINSISGQSTSASSVDSGRYSNGASSVDEDDWTDAERDVDSWAEEYANSRAFNS